MCIQSKHHMLYFECTIFCSPPDFSPSPLLCLDTPSYWAPDLRPFIHFFLNHEQRSWELVSPLDNAVPEFYQTYQRTQALYYWPHICTQITFLREVSEQLSDISRSPTKCSAMILGSHDSLAAVEDPIAKDIRRLHWIHGLRAQVMETVHARPLCQPWIMANGE